LAWDALDPKAETSVGSKNHSAAARRNSVARRNYYFRVAREPQRLEWGRLTIGPQIGYLPHVQPQKLT